MRRLIAISGARPHGAPLRRLVLACAGLLALRSAAASAAADPHAPAAIAQELRSFREFGSVLYVAAHPDDENTQLITYLARGRDYRTAYLSLTRGDGGQNLLGPEFGDLLGVIRTQELLAARGVDGGRQFFSRARDFGYSKDFRQTLTKWDRQQVLSDIVRVIRQFRPDIVVTRFSPEPTTTHGHHTASAALALEAFKLAGDPKAFPEQLGALSVWQPKRILWNRANWNGDPEPDHGIIHVAIDGTDTVTGASFGVLAARSRSMHRTQGFANFSVASLGTGARLESFQVLDGAPAAKDIMDDIDTTWARIPGGAEVGTLAGEALAHFDPKDPAASVPALLQIEDRISKLAADPVVEEKHRQLDRILQACLGLSVEALIAKSEVVPGEILKISETATVSTGIPVIWKGSSLPGERAPQGAPIPLAPNTSSIRETSWALPADTLLSQPYWLRRDAAPGMFQVDDPSLIDRPWNPPTLPIEDTFLVEGHTLVVRHEVLAGISDPSKDVVRRSPEVVAPVSLSFASTVELFAPGSVRDVAVQVTAARANQSGTLSLEAPEGWTLPAGQPFHLANAGDTARLIFSVKAPARPATAAISARADIGDAHFGSGRIAITYEHIPPLLLQPPARLKAVCLELSIRGKSIGYLPGAGDGTADSLSQMGYAVTQLTGDDLTPARLAPFDAVVIGVRAFNTRKDLAAGLPALFSYVEMGGTVVEQYNTPGGLQSSELAPYTLTLSRDLPRFRVTDEHSTVTLLQPDSPAFTTPNRITPADFEGWVQERGLDFASAWDPQHFTPLLSCSDVGEPPLEGGLLVARFGRGYFVYTGLSFFRQLPAGVPGAYRLLANLVSLGR